MTKHDYLAQLAYKLRALPEKDIADALEYYESYLSDAENEAGAMQALGSPSEVAAALMSDYIAQGSTPRESGYRRRPAFKTAYIAILAVFALPIGLPLAMGALGLIIGLLAVVFSFVVTGVALLITGVVTLVTFPFMLMYDPWLALSMGGMGMVCLGLGILIFKSSTRLAGGFPAILRAIRRRGRGGVATMEAPAYSNGFTEQVPAFDQQRGNDGVVPPPSYGAAPPMSARNRVFNFKFATILVVLGAVMFGAAWANGHRGGALVWEDGRFRVETVQSGGRGNLVYLDTAGITAIDIQARSASVTVLPADGRPRMMYDGRVDVNQAGGVINIIDNTPTRVNIGIGYSPSRAIRVYLPHDIYVTVRTASGRIVIDGIVSSHITATSTSGRVRARNINNNSGELNLTSTSGRIDADNIRQGGDISIRATSGSINLDNADWANLNATTSSGRIRIKGRADDGSTTSISASSGSIGLEIDGRQEDFTVSTRASSGSVRVGGTRFSERNVDAIGAGANLIDVRTTSGRITVDFVR